MNEPRNFCCFVGKGPYDVGFFMPLGFSIPKPIAGPTKKPPSRSVVEDETLRLQNDRRDLPCFQTFCNQNQGDLAALCLADLTIFLGGGALMMMGCKRYGMKPKSWRRRLFLPLKPHPFSGLREISSNIRDFAVRNASVLLILVFYLVFQHLRLGHLVVPNFSGNRSCHNITA